MHYRTCHPYSAQCTRILQKKYHWCPTPSLTPWPLSSNPLPHTPTIVPCLHYWTYKDYKKTCTMNEQWIVQRDQCPCRHFYHKTTCKTWYNCVHPFTPAVSVNMSINTREYKEWGSCFSCNEFGCSRQSYNSAGAIYHNFTRQRELWTWFCEQAPCCHRECWWHTPLTFQTLMSLYLFWYQIKAMQLQQCLFYIFWSTICHCPLTQQLRASSSLAE